MLSQKDSNPREISHFSKFHIILTAQGKHFFHSCRYNAKNSQPSNSHAYLKKECLCYVAFVLFTAMGSESESDNNSGQDSYQDKPTVTEDDQEYRTTLGETYRHGNSHSSLTRAIPQTGTGKSWKNDGETRGTFGGKSYRNEYSWNRANHQTVTDHTSWRNHGRGFGENHSSWRRTGAPQVVTERSTWRRNDRQERGNVGARLHPQPMNQRSRAVSTESGQEQQRGGSPVTRDYFRRPGRTGYSG